LHYLDQKIFGKITTKEIIGAEPPVTPDTQDLLENELAILVSELESQSKDNLEKLLEQQQAAEDHVNSRPGAMALSQPKIQLFTKYSQKYIESIKQKLES
jgi:hypothetical protein